MKISPYAPLSTRFDRYEDMCGHGKCCDESGSQASNYSLRNESTGFDVAAFADWYPMESRTIKNITTDVRT